MLKRNAQNAQDSALLSPPSKVIMRGPPVGKFSRQHPPLGSSFHHVQDCIQHVAGEVMASFVTGRKVAGDLFPLGAKGQES
jgi:hypothetical protein